MSDVRHMHGHVTAEYLVVLAGLIVVWLSADLVLEVFREHQGALSWALALPL